MFCFTSGENFVSFTTAVYLLPIDRRDLGLDFVAYKKMLSNRHCCLECGVVPTGAYECVFVWVKKTLP